MTIQQACDRLTELCHQGLAQAKLMYINGTLVKEVGGFEKMDGETVLVRSVIKWPEPYKPEYYEAEVINGRATGKAIKHQEEDK